MRTGAASRAGRMGGGMGWLALVDAAVQRVLNGAVSTFQASLALALPRMNTVAVPCRNKAPPIRIPQNSTLVLG